MVSLSVSAWLWRRDALCHYKLQFWSHWCRKAASLQGADETQSNRDVMTFSTQHRLIALYSSWPVSHAKPVSVGLWMYRTEVESERFFISRRSLTEQPVSQTLQEMAAFLWLDFLSENPGCSHHVLKPTFDGAVKECSVFLSHGQ